MTNSETSDSPCAFVAVMASSDSSDPNPLTREVLRGLRKLADRAVDSLHCRKHYSPMYEPALESVEHTRALEWLEREEYLAILERRP